MNGTACLIIGARTGHRYRCRLLVRWAKHQQAVQVTEKQMQDIQCPAKRVKPVETISRKHSKDAAIAGEIHVGSRRAVSDKCFAIITRL